MRLCKSRKWAEIEIRQDTLQFVAEHYVRLRRLVERRCNGDLELADETFGDVIYIFVQNSLDSFDYTKSANADKVLHVLRNLCYHVNRYVTLKQTSGHIPFSLFETDLPFDVAENDYTAEVESATEAREMVYKLLDCLPETSRRVVVLRMNLELTFADIGQRFGCGESWARKTYETALDLMYYYGTLRTE